MQSGGGAYQGGGGGGYGRNTAVGPSSSSASPSSSSSAVSAPQMGFESMQQQQQQQQRQLLQQQLAHQSGGLHGVLGGGNFDQRMMNPNHQVHHQAYMQYAFQAQQQQAQQKSLVGMQAHQHIKMGMVGPSTKDQDPRTVNMKMQDLISMQAADQAQSSLSKRPSEPFDRGEILMENGQPMVSDQRSDQLSSGNNIRHMSVPQSQPSMQNIANNQLAMAAQMQAMQLLALEQNIDLSLPANAHLVSQLIPFMQSRILAQQKANENNMGPQSSSVSLPKQQATSPQIANESSPRCNSSNDVSGKFGSNKPRQTVLPSQLGAVSNAMLINNQSNSPSPQFPVPGWENQLPPRQPVVGSGMSSMQPPQSSMNLNKGADHSLLAKSLLTSPKALQMKPDVGLGNPSTSQVTPGPQIRKSSAFTKQQLQVLKAQILAFKRLKKGDGTMPQEILQLIVPPPLEAQVNQGVSSAVTVNLDRPTGRNVEDHARLSESSERGLQSMTSTNGLNKAADKEAPAPAVNIQGVIAVMKEPIPVVCPVKEGPKTMVFSASLQQPASDASLDSVKAATTQIAAISDTVQAKNGIQAGNVSQPKDVGPSRKYHGPLFDFPFFTRKHDSLGSSVLLNNNNNLTLAYDVKDILVEEGSEALDKKRSETIRKIDSLLAVNLERKRIRPDLALKLQIEEKKLKNWEIQARVRGDVEEEQKEVMEMPDRVYRKFVRLCERQRNDLDRQLQASQKAIREKQLKLIFQWRKKLLEAHWGIRDARTARNRGVAKYHERMLREFSKRKDDGRNSRMEALKNNDVERYREMLLEQQTSVLGEAAERYEVLSSFLSQTEDYLHKLGSKITAAKNQQEVEEAANAAAAAARAQGLSEEEVRAAASCAGEEVMIRNRFSEMNAPRPQDGSSVSKYYTLAHAVNERVIRQPSMLRMGTLRDYQLVGLQWMLSLYNNKLNGILADEMGLGKTVQVMALIAYLMEFKGNYGPHLIIVPNAVLVNWKSELRNWLPSVSCIYYVGGKDQRSKLFSQEVSAMKFNVLVTTYEFIMFDRSKLSKVDWKYIIIDEAQRMKDRESVLARDLDRYRCQRRLLLTGTPLQNDLKELWSLLNLLLPEVFDNRKAFHDWFSKPFQKETQSVEDDWLETEKKVITIHRLHQILEPFMLRRRVEDVEGSLPRKISIILRCKMSAIQGTIYDWIKSTGTLRVDPEDEKRKVKNPLYTAKPYKTLTNRCMELRKTCNHPLLNYPYFNDFSKDFLVRSCGKLWVLDRVLIKLQRAGHRVLLFSTMTKLLDILEEYLQWRQLVYRRIDGTTSLEDRESAIVEFNRPDTDCFIFLLSIRAAGRGLNLQTADTVIIYDPDPNPKNEEQAVARAHRIGQTREVKVIYMEAVVDKVPSHQKEDEYRNGGAVDTEDDNAGTDRYIGSIESLIRNNIQQYKIDMADEVINAGRFDQRTTHEERRLTLETMLHDEERYQETVHNVPSLQQVNRMIARSEEEVELFNQMDEEFDWEEEMTSYDEVPKWLRAGTREVDNAIAALSKKTSKNHLYSEIDYEVTERKRGRPKGKKVPNYAELDDDADFFEASSEERNGYSREGDGEIGESEDEVVGTAEATGVDKDYLEDGLVSEDGHEYSRPPEPTRNNHILEQARSSGSSADSRRVMQMVSPSISSQKFGSLSALDTRPSSVSKRLPDDTEGEIGLSEDSRTDLQQSGSWTHDREEGEDEQVLQPKFKRKRSFRARPRLVAKPSLVRSDTSQLQFQVDRKNEVKGRIDNEQRLLVGTTTYKPDLGDSSLKSNRSLPSRKNPNREMTSTPLRPNRMPAPQEVGPEHSRECWNANAVSTSKISDGIRKRCKEIIGKIQRRIDKEGEQIIPLLTDLWKRTENSGNPRGAGSNFLNLRKIMQRFDRFEYGVMEFVADVQLMLKSGMQYFRFTHEVRSEARRVHELFFDLLMIAFPDKDFQEARSSLSFSRSSKAVSASSLPSPRQVLPGQSQSKLKRPRQSTQVEPNPIPTQKSTPRTHMPQRESRFGSSSSSREVAPQDKESRPFITHPGELVICKKKRNDREKSTGVKTGNMSVGPVSPSGIACGIRSPGQQQGWSNLSPQQVSGGSGSVGWANPVKKMRTDAGRRRPSHL